MTEEEWREELRRLYDEAHEKKNRKDDPPDTGGGVREPRRPRPQSPAGGAEAPIPERRAQREADVQELGRDPKFLERVGQAVAFFESRGVK